MSTETSGNRVTNLSDENFIYNMVSGAVQHDHNIRSTRPSKKGIAFGKRSNSMKRNPNAEVTKMGWLFKQASSGVKQWNKRWFVLVDRCLFYYKDDREEVILGSIPLLNFHISHLQSSDNISRKHTFKVTVYCWAGDESLNNEVQMSRQTEYTDVRTYYFSAESREEQESWLRVMEETSHTQNPHTYRKERQDSKNVPPSRSHDSELQSRGEGDGKGSEKLEWRLECPNTCLSSANGAGTLSNRILDLESSRHLPEGEPPPQPGGWDCVPLTLQSNTAFSEGSEQRRANLSYPEKVSQRQNSMTQLQQWVNLRKTAAPTEEIQSPNRYIPGRHRMPTYYPQYPSQYPDGYQYYSPAGSRPDSIALSTFDRGIPQWDLGDRQHVLNNRTSYLTWKDTGVYGHQAEMLTHRPPMYYQEPDAVSEALHHLSLQPRSHSVPRSPSHEAYISHQRLYSPVHFPSARFKTGSWNDHFLEPATHTMRRSSSSPKYAFLENRPPFPGQMYSHSYPASPPLNGKMMTESETLISMVNNKMHSSPRAQIFMQVSPYADPYREALQNYKFNEQDTDKLLGRLCEQHKVVKEQDQLVQQLRAEKESLESALMGTHQEMEMFGNQTAFTEKLLRRKESLQNQLISIRVELSQATTALNKSIVDYELQEGEVSALHDALWEQLNLNIKNELMNRHIQREIWRIQDVMEGLKKNNPSRGTDTAKHRVVTGSSTTFGSNSPSSPLSTASLTSPVSPFSLISGSQESPTKHTTSEDSAPPRPPLPLSYTILDSPSAVSLPPGEDLFKPWSYPVSLYCPYSKVKLNLEPYKRESTALPNDMDTDKHWQLQGQVINKVGIVPPLTKSPNEQGLKTKPLVLRREGDASNTSNTKERPKSALLCGEIKSKMSVEEQIDRMKRHQSGSVKEKRRSLQLPSSQRIDFTTSKSASTYRGIRRHRSIHEVDILNLEAVLRSQGSQKMFESPKEEIARLRKMELEPQALNIYNNRELYTSDKVLIPESYHGMEPEIPLSPEELQEKQRKVERIKTLIAKSSLQNVIPLCDSELEKPLDTESHLLEQEKRIELTCALATEASRRGRLLSALCSTPSPPTSPTSPAQHILPSSECSALGECSNSDSSEECGATIMSV